MASQLYESVLKNDAKRDALKKKPAKPLPHPQRKPTSKGGTAKFFADKSERDKAFAEADAKRKAAATKTPDKPATSTKETDLAANNKKFFGSIDERNRKIAEGTANRPGVVEQVKQFRDNVRQRVADWRAKNRPDADKPPGPSRGATEAKADEPKGKAAVTPGKPSTPNTRPPGNAAASKRSPTLTTDKPSGKSGTGRMPIKAAPAPSTKPTPPKASSAAKPKGSVGAASNRDLPGRTTITYASKTKAPGATSDKPSNYGTTTGGPRKLIPDGPKRDASALRARSKQSLADSQKAAAARRNGPGGGSDNVLRGRLSRWAGQNRNK